MPRLSLVENTGTSFWDDGAMTPLPDPEELLILNEFYAHTWASGISPAKQAEAIENDPDAMDIIRCEQGQNF